MYPPLAVRSTSCLTHSQKLTLHHSQHTNQCWLWDELIEQEENIKALIQRQGAKISFSTASMVPSQFYDGQDVAFSVSIEIALIWF